MKEILSNEEIKEIRRSLEEVKQGKVSSIEEVAKGLGIKLENLK